MMQYDDNCKTCPYYLQNHLTGLSRTTRESPAITLENNSSSTLLLFQSPGDNEWHAGKAIQPTIKQGGTAGVRIKNSWERKNKSRTDFDIINAVQCFPGNDGDRDLSPKLMAICSCSKRLQSVLESKKYKEIIVFGSIAEEAVEELSKKVNYSANVVKAPHPNGGIKNATLDVLW